MQKLGLSMHTHRLCALLSGASLLLGLCPTSTPCAEETPATLTPEVASGSRPLFPYFYQRFPNDETQLRELGYHPTPHLLTRLDCSKPQPYDSEKVHHWMRSMKGKAPGFVFVKVDDASDEEAFVRVLREMAVVAEEVGFFITIYPYFGSAIPTAESALPSVEKVAHPRVGLTLHSFQEIRSGNTMRIDDIIGKVKDRINLVVVCGTDMPGPDDDPGKWPPSRLIQPLHTSGFDIPHLVRSVEATGYRGYYGQICWGLEQPALDYLPKDIELWNSIFLTPNNEHQKEEY